MKKSFHKPYVEIIRLETSENIIGTCVLECLCDINCNECDCVTNCQIIVDPSSK